MQSPIGTDEGRSVVPDKNPDLDSRVRLLEVQLDTDSGRGFLFPTRREFYGKNFQIRILNRGQVEKLTSLTKRI